MCVYLVVDTRMFKTLLDYYDSLIFALPFNCAQHVI